MDLQQTHQLSSQDTVPTEGNLHPGTILQERYQIMEVRGHGGMAMVYKARDLRFDKVERICAVKELYNTAPDPRLRELVIQSFDREANTLASLNHPAIPSIYDYFDEGNRIYLVMEFIQGRDLEQIIEENDGPLDQETVIDWAIQILDVLDYLHTLNPAFIFRDLKPSNVMLNERDRIMLIDFGIAKVFERGQRGTMIGTAGYPPPEQYRGMAEPRGDLYALGATMHHLLTKRDPRLEPPFSFHDHPIHQSNPEVSDALATIVMKALEYDIEKRFASAKEMREALKALTQPVAAAGQQSSMPSTVAFPTSAISFARTGNVLPIWEFPCEDEIRSSPLLSDGLVYIGSFDHNLYAVDAKEGTFAWKYPTQDVVSGSPHASGDLVFIGSEDRFIYALLKDTGDIVWSQRTGDRIRSSPRVALEHVFFGSDDHNMYCLAARNGREVWRFETSSFVRSTPTVSEQLVYFGSSDGGVYAVDIQTGKQKWKYATNRTVIAAPLLHDEFIFAGSMDWNVYAIDAERGWSIWNFRTRGWVVSSPAFSATYGLVYVGSADGNVYGIDYEKGRRVWNYETEGGVISSPAVTEEAVYIGSQDGHLYSLDAKNGELRWKFYTGAPVVSSPALSDDMVYVGSMNNRLYALLL